jgi:hypothetical protein
VKGHHSDGEIGPFFDAIDSKGGQVYDDDEELQEDCDKLPLKNADFLTANVDDPTQHADAPSNPSVAAIAISNNPEMNAAKAIVGPSSKV